MTSQIYIDLSLSNNLSLYTVQYLFLKRKGNLITLNTLPVLNDYEGIFRLHSEDVSDVAEAMKHAMLRV